jgi:hypothetical protein
LFEKNETELVFSWSHLWGKAVSTICGWPSRQQKHKKLVSVVCQVWKFIVNLFLDRYQYLMAFLFYYVSCDLMYSNIRICFFR